MTKYTTFTLDSGDVLTLEVNIQANSMRGDDAYAAEFYLSKQHGEDPFPEEALSKAERTRLEDLLSGMAYDYGGEAGQDWAEAQGDAYHDRIKDGE